MIIDSHIHLNAPDYANELDALLAEAVQSGVGTFISVGAGYGAKSAKEAVALANNYDFIYASVGIHPNDANEEIDFSEIENLAKEEKVVAIGETGLDYYWNRTSKENQKKYFLKQIELAKKVQKPLIIHSREAGRDCLDILIKNSAQEVGGVFHCFAEDENFAKELKKINFKVSFTGALTFKNAAETRRIFKEIPLEQILIETDGPFLAPMPYRGKLCRPSYIIETAKKMAEIKDLKLEELCAILETNTRSFYKI